MWVSYLIACYDCGLGVVRGVYFGFVYLVGWWFSVGVVGLIECAW